MRKLFSFLTILFIAVISSACINSYAVKELNEKAGAYLQKGDVQSAIARLESSIDLDDSIFESRYNLAIAYLKVDNCAAALEQIKAAESLANKENIANVYYTAGVANNCLAEQIYKKDVADDGSQTPVSDNNPKLAQDYVNYLEAANLFFEKYLNSDSNAKDAQQVKALINENNELIQTKKEENGLQ